MKAMNKHSLSSNIGVNRVGWFAIRDRQGWVGTEEGVTCYKFRKFARVAMTILWQRDGGGPVNYRIARFFGEVRKISEHTPIKSAEEAITDYERKEHP